MVDAEPGSHRPRRALEEPAAQPDVPAGDFDDEDQPKPLYRDEVTDEGAMGGSSGAHPVGVDADRSTPRPITFTPRRVRPFEDEATTILPRVPRSRAAEPEQFDDDTDNRRPLGSRTRTALLVGAVAAVVVIGLAVFYAVGGVGKTPAVIPTPVTSASVSVNPSGSASPSGSAGPSGGGALLSDTSMLTVQDAGLIASGRTWKAASTDDGNSPDAAQPACFTAEPAEGQPTAQQRIVRLLSSNGKKPPGVLHQASSYASPEEAVQAYAVAAKTLGTCAVIGSYLVQGQTVTGLGDQAVGVVVASVVNGKTQQHTVLLNRTGRVMNVVDAAQPATAISFRAVAKALVALTARQCTAAGGACATKATLKDGPPPLGGDVPGFLAYGDLPPAGKTATGWGATPTEMPKDDFTGSGCETVNWSTLSTESTMSRTYILDDASSSFFGLNDIVVEMKDEAAATKLVAKIKADLDSCGKRKLTAKISNPKKASSVGAKQTPVSGWTAEVSQKSTDGTKKYRVGIVSAGKKVAYTFLNPQDGFDFTDAQWGTVAVRAGERTTQVN